MDIHPRARTRPATNHACSSRVDRAHRAGQPGLGVHRIQGALANLKHSVGRGTIANVLKRNGIEPAPERGKRTRWSTLLRAHWKVLAASDFLPVEVWTGRGLATHSLL